MDCKRFSIIMCTYNGGDRLLKVINSVITQELYDELVEQFIIVDNNSNDNTKDIVYKYLSEKGNISYSFERIQGLSFARLNGVNLSTGEWIIFIDDDNILKEQWLKSAEEYIKSHKDVGAFNGAVIPKIEEKMEERKITILRNVLQGLACTHMDFSEINYNDFSHPYRFPFGAGLIIKAKPMRILAENGWISNKGRTQNNLISCDDTEMCLFIKKQGLKFGFNPYMKIEHIISINRLEEKYLKSLWRSFAIGNYMIITNQKFYVAKRLIFLIILYFRWVRNKIIHRNSANQFKCKLDNIYREQFLESLLEDCFIKR